LDNRQCSQKYRVDKTEGGGDRADSERERQDGRRARSSMLRQLTPSEDQVGAERVDPGGELYVSTTFPCPDCGAKRSSRFVGVATVRDGFLQVRLQLFTDLAIKTFAPKNIRDTRPQ
jgi:predicted RNA-binding Zn-ribbon protein involved in translation (DUF1610 family)